MKLRPAHFLLTSLADVAAWAQPSAGILQFSEMAEVRTGARTAAVIAVDLNADKIPDIVATNQGDGTISVALGLGRGTFKAAASYPTGIVGPYETAAADFNGDGFPDLVSANFGAARGEPYGLTVSVHLNRGDGSFAGCVDYPATQAAEDKIRAVATGDFNGDGKADLAVAAQHSGLQILFGKGDGSFGKPVLHDAGRGVHGVVIADFDQDGKADVALANNGPRGGVNVLLGKGNGDFSQTAAYAAGAGTFGLVAGDVNGDGFPDIITANERDGSISVLLNRGRSGRGKFADSINYAATGKPVSVSLGDLDGDGKPEVLSSSNSGGVTDIYRNQSGGTFAPSKPVQTGGGSYDSAVADFDGDGIPDFASARTGGSVLIMKGQRH